MAVEEAKYEPFLTRYMMDKAYMAEIPISGTFELSPLCNFDCRMCYIRKSMQEVVNHDRMPVNMEQWLEIAQKARDKGMLYLLLTGGEPFLWPDFWPLYEKLSHMGFLISINTNGSLIDAEVIARLKQHPPMRVNITLYGASDETYEGLCRAKGVFSKVDQAIRGLKEAGIQVKLNCSLTPHNASDLEAMNAYAVANGLIFDVVTYMFPPLRRDISMVGRNDRFTPYEAAYYHMKRILVQNGEESYRNFLNKAAEGLIPPLGLDESCVDPLDGQIRCRAGRTSFWITWDGYMTPCGMMPTPKVDLIQLGFDESWQQTVQASKNVRLSGVCSQCLDREMCHACAAMALAETGKTTGIPEYLCHMVQEMKRIAAEQLATGNYANPGIG